MTDLGMAIFFAMADQRWALAFHGEWLVVWSPVTRRQFGIPEAWLVDEALEGELRVVLLLLMAHGLEFED